MEERVLTQGQAGRIPQWVRIRRRKHLAWNGYFSINVKILMLPLSLLLAWLLIFRFLSYSLLKKINWVVLFVWNWTKDLVQRNCPNAINLKSRWKFFQASHPGSYMAIKVFIWKMCEARKKYIDTKHTLLEFPVGEDSLCFWVTPFCFDFF